MTRISTPSPDPTSARARLEEATTLIETLTARTTEVAALATALEQAQRTYDELGGYYFGGDWLQDVEVATRDADGALPSAAGEDLAWEALAEHEAVVLRALAAVTDSLTRIHRRD